MAVLAAASGGDALPVPVPRRVASRRVAFVTAEARKGADPCARASDAARPPAPPTSTSGFALAARLQLFSALDHAF
ncbi:hypothetical protein WG70_10250 [Burkholderia oklahomensis EO147]|nr:hypothetical protein WG70_10250 [Burkholderia oklahomensis EO147]KUY62124.1 hypothetical protein WG70_05350 [Burkholderia oklahomensis EO147]